MKFIDWIRRSFEEKDGTPSSRRLTVFAAVVLYITGNIVFWCKVQDPVYLLYNQALNIAFILLLIGLLTVQAIIEIIRLIKNRNTPANDTKASTETA
jgi:hypothetical protein